MKTLHEEHVQKYAKEYKALTQIQFLIFVTLIETPTGVKLTELIECLRYREKDHNAANNIAVHISQIRKRFAAAGLKYTITVRKAGILTETTYFAQATE